MSSPAEPSRLRLSIDSRLDQVSSVGHCIQCLCKAAGLDDMGAYQVQTAVVEAINNAIIHAYRRLPEHRVDILWQRDARMLTIEVQDNGHGMERMPPLEAPPPDAENGRGWWIMRQWMDNAEYVQDPERNRVILTKSLTPS